MSYLAYSMIDPVLAKLKEELEGQRFIVHTLSRDNNNLRERIKKLTGVDSSPPSGYGGCSYRTNVTIHQIWCNMCHFQKTINDSEVRAKEVFAEHCRVTHGLYSGNTYFGGTEMTIPNDGR